MTQPPVRVLCRECWWSRPATHMAPGNEGGLFCCIDRPVHTVIALNDPKGGPPTVLTQWSVRVVDEEHFCPDGVMDMAKINPTGLTQ